MDRNSIIGLVIIGAILIGYSYFTRPSEAQIAEQKRIRDSIANVEEQRRVAEEQVSKQAFQATDTTVVENDSLKSEKLKGMYGDFASAASGEQKFVTLENDLLKLTFSNKGGKVYSVEVKNYKTYDGKPLILFNGDKNEFGFQFFAQNRSIKTNDLFFTTDAPESVIADKTGKSVKYRLYAGADKYLEYVYTIKDGSYLVDFDINLEKFNQVLPSNSAFLDLSWKTDLLQLEKGRSNENTYTNLSYRFSDEEVEQVDALSGVNEEPIKLTTKVQWIAFKQQFFSSILTADKAFTNADLAFKVYESGEALKNFSANISVPIESKDKESIGLSIYYGPNHYKTLKAFDRKYEKIVPLGWKIFAWVNKIAVIPIFNWLGDSIASMGLIILILTIIIKLVIFPLTYKSYLSSAKMRVLKPQVDEIGKKFPKKEDALKKQQAVMGLYRKVGVSPLGGCIPLLIQFPILIAMFKFFPASIELRQKSFLWADDLSSYDSILDLPFNIPFYGDHISLFTLLMAGALVLSTRMNTAQMSDANAQLPGMKFMMNVVMPIMMVFWFNSYASGLSYYYFLSNMITIGQTYLIRGFVDDKAILAKLEENKAKPVKKSGFQQKLEEMAKKRGMQMPK